MSLGSCMQIRYTHKLSMHKADFSQNREVCVTFLVMPYNYHLVYKPSKDEKNPADFLSRHRNCSEP